MSKMKKSWLLVLGLFALPVAYYSYVLAAYSYQRFTVSGSQIYELYSDGAVTIAGPLKSGNNYTGSSVTLPTTSTGAKFAHWVPVYNPTGSSIAAGTILIASNTGTGYVQPVPSVLSTTTVVGVAAEAIASVTKGWMIPLGGGYAIVLTSGTVAIGDVLVTTGTSAGRAGPNNTPTSGTDIGVAVSASGTSTGGSVLAILR